MTKMNRKRSACAVTTQVKGYTYFMRYHNNMNSLQLQSVLKKCYTFYEFTDPDDQEQELVSSHHMANLVTMSTNTMSKTIFA